MARYWFLALSERPTLFLSIIVPTYNRLQYLKEALASVEYSERDDYEIIVVDDVSSDGTWEWLQEWHDGGRRKALRLEDNSGPGWARNAGAEIARGRHLAFLDSDDLWFPYSIDALKLQLATEFPPDVLMHSCIDFDGIAPDPPSDLTPRSKSFEDVLSGLSQSPVFISASAIVVARDAFRRSGGFSFKRMNAEDHDFLLRLGCVGPLVLLSEPPIFAYRRHGQSLVSNSALSIRGYSHLVSSERVGLFPGGNKRRRERLIVLTRILRPAILSLFGEKNYSQAFDLYRKSFTWNLRELRFRFLLGAWLRALGIRVGG